MSRVSQLLKIAHEKSSEVFTVTPGMSIMFAARFAREKNVGALPVLNAGGKLIGIITERDFTEILARRIDPNYVSVGDYMTPNPATVTPFTDLLDCFNLMRDIGVRHLPVVENGNLVGIVSIRDVLYMMLRNQEILAENMQAYILGSR